MDFNLIIGSLQLALASFQLKLDHFTRPANRRESEDLDQFYELGEGIRVLESALAETVSFVGQTSNREPNPRLASLWEDASRAIRRINNGAELADLTFEKNLYWRNPQFYKEKSESRLYRISLDNVLTQLRHLRADYDRLQKKVNGY